jgi:hypothetical protein
MQVPDDKNLLFYSYAKKKFEELGFDMPKCPITRFGNPEDLAEREGNSWSWAHLQCRSMFADVARFIKLDENPII